MIKLNLLKKKPVVHGIPNEKEGMKLITLVVISVFLGAVLTAFVVTLVTGISKAKNDDVATFKNVNTTASNYDTSGVLIDSVNGNPPTPKSDYERMSIVERVNYEHKFTYLFFRDLSIITPKQVDFNKITVDKFKNYLFIGGIDNKQAVVDLFLSLKKAPWTIYPKPRSFIRSVKKDFQFKVEGEYNVLISDLKNGMLTASDILSFDHLQEIKNSVERVIKKSPVTIRQELTLLDTKFDGEYRSYYYTINGRSSYFQFKEMVRNIYLIKTPISIEKTVLQADSGGLDWTIVVKITVKA